MARRLLLLVALSLYHLLASKLDGYKTGLAAAQWPDLRWILEWIVAWWRS
jgi:hypothetical protein